MELGAGRATKDDVIDFKAGIMLLKKPGDKVSKGDVIARLYTDKEKSLPNAEKTVIEALTFSDEAVARGKMIYKVVR